MSYEHIHVNINEVEIAPELAALLEASAAMHHHLCPRQVLGVRMGLAGAAALGFDVPRSDKKLLVIVETDGCLISGLQVATGCRVNRRTMRIVDLGRIGATFLDVKKETAVRVTPQQDIRDKAWRYVPPDQRRRYFAMLEGYQTMPNDELLHVQPVTLTQPVRELLSRPGVRVNCEQCGEEVINEREVMVNGRILCQHCAGGSYYELGIGNRGSGIGD